MPKVNKPNKENVEYSKVNTGRTYGIGKHSANAFEKIFHVNADRGLIKHGEKEEAVEIDRLADFMARFEKCGSRKDDEGLKVDIKGHSAWKSKGRIVKNDDPADQNEYRDKGGDCENCDLMPTQFDFNRGSLKEIAGSDRKKLNNLKNRKSEVLFKTHEKRLQVAYGNGLDVDYQILKEYLQTHGKEFTSNYKKGPYKNNGTSLDVRFSTWKK